jgi:hypothetical protein
MFMNPLDATLRAGSAVALLAFSGAPGESSHQAPALDEFNMPDGTSPD